MFLPDRDRSPAKFSGLLKFSIQIEYIRTVFPMETEMKKALTKLQFKEKSQFKENSRQNMK